MKERYFSTFQLIMLALFSALVVAAKVALRLPLQMSGHSGIFWMAIIIWQREWYPGTAPRHSWD